MNNIEIMKIVLKYNFTNCELIYFNTYESYIDLFIDKILFARYIMDRNRWVTVYTMSSNLEECFEDYYE